MHSFINRKREGREKEKDREERGGREREREKIYSPKSKFNVKLELYRADCCYDLTTLSYTELEHTQSHIASRVGVVNKPQAC